MPNYNITVSSRFNPYSFEEYLKPYALYNSAYKETEEAYNKIAENALILDKLIGENDTEVRGIYDNFKNSLKDNVDTMLSNGLTQSVRTNLNKLRNTYYNDILAIQNAYNTRAAQAKEQQELYNRDNSMLFERSAATTSLDDYYRNPQLSYRHTSLNDIEKKASDIAKELSKQLFHNPTYIGTGNRPNIEEFIATHLGMKVQDVQKGNDILDTITKNVIKASGVENWSNYDEIKNQVLQSAKNGLYRSIGQSSITANPFIANGNGTNDNGNDNRPYAVLLENNDVDPSIKTTDIYNNMNSVLSVLSSPDPSKYFSKVEYSNAPSFNDSKGSYTAIPYTTRKRIEDTLSYPSLGITLKYDNTNNTVKAYDTDDKEINNEDIRKIAENRIKQAAITTNKYILNTTNKSLLNDYVKNLLNVGMDVDSDNINHLFEDDKTRKKIKKDDLDKYFNDDTQIYFDSKDNKFHAVSTKDSKVYNSIISDDIFKPMFGNLNPLTIIKSIKDNGDIESYGDAVNSMFQLINNHINAQNPVRPTSSSKAAI